jgi:hypothetical protein
MGKDENSGVYTKREIPVHHKQNEADQIMETEEQRTMRLKAAWNASGTADLGALFEYNSIDAEAELTRILSEEIDKEIVKSLKRMVNNVPIVSDKIRRLPCR